MLCNWRRLNNFQGLQIFIGLSKMRSCQPKFSRFWGNGDIIFLHLSLQGVQRHTHVRDWVINNLSLPFTIFFSIYSASTQHFLYGRPPPIMILPNLCHAVNAWAKNVANVQLHIYIQLQLYSAQGSDVWDDSIDDWNRGEMSINIEFM